MTNLHSSLLSKVRLVASADEKLSLVSLDVNQLNLRIACNEQEWELLAETFDFLNEGFVSIKPIVVCYSFFFTAFDDVENRLLSLTCNC